MFVKFNAQGKLESYSYVEKKENLIPYDEAFEELLLSVEKEDICYLEKQNGRIFINEQRKQTDKLIAEKERNISGLKAQLSAIDYKTSKYVDGDYTQAEWEAVVAERKALREQIRTLEKMI